MLIHAPDHPVKIVAVRGVPDAIRGSVLEPTPGPDGRPPVGVYRIEVTLPPGTQIPDDAEPCIEVETNSRYPEYQKIRVPVQLLGQRSPTAQAPPPTAPPHQ